MLSQVTHWYNKLHSNILDVELQLVKAELEEARNTLSPALKDLRWSQEELWDYIQRLYSFSDVIFLINAFLVCSFSNVFFLRYWQP